MIVLTKEQVLMLHAQLITETGGSPGLKHTKSIPLFHRKLPVLESVLHKIMLIFLALNQIELSYTQSELSDIFLDIAAGTYSFSDLVQWILNHRI